MQISSNKAIRLPDQTELKQQVSEFKQQVANSDGVLAAFEFQLRNQDDFFAQLDFLRNAENFQPPQFNQNKLGLPQQTSGTTTEQQDKLEQYAKQRLPSFIDEVFTKLAMRGNANAAGTALDEEKAYLSNQIEQAINADDPNTIYDTLQANLYSLSEVLFSEAQFMSMMQNFDATQPFNTQAGIAGEVGSIQARYDQVYAQIAEKNDDTAFVELLKKRREEFIKPLEKNLTQVLGFNPYKEPSFNSHYNASAGMPLSLYDGFTRIKSINILV
ncbi:hypothetical protein [Rheinheimera fenheensis]|uniref:hypothetical protein n=1 Tax=Rheinheimera fenheensis TaxID=3152295 RepID=UPI003261C22B